MAPRPNWKGYLKLSLVSCPIALYPATSASERVSFRQINKKTGNRLRQQLVDDISREPINPEDKGRGYEIGKGQFIQIDDDELDAIQVESTHTIEIEKFVPLSVIDVRYYDSPYYIIPNDEVGLDAFAVIRDAMVSKKMVGIGRVVLQKRERERVFRGHSGAEARARYAQARGAHRGYESRSLSARGVCRSLRGRTRRAVENEASGPAAKKPTPAMPRPSGANIFDLVRRSVELESKSKKTKAPPLQPELSKKKPTRQRARG